MYIYTYVCFFSDRAHLWTRPNNLTLLRFGDPCSLVIVQCFIWKHRSRTQWFYVNFWCTPPKINIAPENDGLEDDFPFPGVYSQVHVNLPGCKSLLKKIIKRKFISTEATIPSAIHWGTPTDGMTLLSDPVVFWKKSPSFMSSSLPTKICSSIIKNSLNLIIFLVGGEVKDVSNP